MCTLDCQKTFFLASFTSIGVCYDGCTVDVLLLVFFMVLAVLHCNACMDWWPLLITVVCVLYATCSSSNTLRLYNLNSHPWVPRLASVHVTVESWPWPDLGARCSALSASTLLLSGWDPHHLALGECRQPLAWSRVKWSWACSWEYWLTPVQRCDSVTATMCRLAFLFWLLLVCLKWNINTQTHGRIQWVVMLAVAHSTQVQIAKGHGKKYWVTTNVRMNWWKKCGDHIYIYIYIRPVRRGGSVGSNEPPPRCTKSVR